MHPFFLEFGQFRVPTYGVVSLVTLAVAVLLIHRVARLEGLPPWPTAEAVVLTVAVGYFGARLFELAINWNRYVGRPDGLKLLALSSGVFYGGLITAIPFCVVWFRHVGLPVLQGLDLLALTGCVAEGVGRWGCFFSGCCYGKPSDLPWAVTFPESARGLHAGLPGVPIHPTQVYLSLTALMILGVLLIAYRKKRFHGRIIAGYVMLYSVARFFIEFLRGDADRGGVLGGKLSTSQFLAVPVFAIAAGAYVALARRYRRSGQPALGPAR